VRSLTNFGAFVEIEPGVDGMIHISDLSWTRKHSHPGEALHKGQEIKCVVLEVNEEKRRVSLGMKQMTEDPWIRAIPEKYIPGHIIKGKVAKLTNFGAFVELESDLEGLLHISELADHKIDKPQDIVKAGDEVEVKILKVDTDARKIGLSLRRVQWAAEEQAATAKTTKTVKKETPAGPEKVLSDADVDRLSKSQTQTEPAKESKEEVETSKTEEDSKPESADVKETETAEAEAGDSEEPKTSKNSILGIFRRKKSTPSDDKAETSEEPVIEQSNESKGSEEQTSDDSGPEEKTEGE
jgi:small subunit ribosomal protein S1